MVGSLGFICGCLPPNAPKVKPPPNLDLRLPQSEPAPPPVEGVSALEAGFEQCAGADSGAWLPEVLSIAGLNDVPSWDGYRSSEAQSLGRGITALADQLREHPEDASCVQFVLQQEFNPQVSQLIRRSAAWQGAAVSQRREAPRSDSFDEAVERLCAATFSDDCPVSGELPEDMQQAFIPLFDAMSVSLEVMSQRRPPRKADWWWEHGGNGSVSGATSGAPDLTVPSHMDYLLENRGAVFEESARLAEVIEDIDWSQFVEFSGSFDIHTQAGRIAVRGMGDDVMAPDAGPTLLWVDVGGDDVYRGPVASNASGANTISLGIDVGGSDRYLPASVDVESMELTDDGSDRRSIAGRFQNASVDAVSGPGAGRHGIALHFDLGSENDHYRSYRFGLGYAHQGVGILFDDGGDDTYQAEAVAMGAARSGIAALIDVSGDDSYLAEYGAQGFGQTAGMGILLDAAGDDNYACRSSDSGVRYITPQIASAGASFCQGAGAGLVSSNPDIAASGGIGLMIDRAGQDNYAVEVFGQGVGFREGIGILSDDDGDDSYDGVWYAMGAGAHFGVGVLVDSSGDDRYGTPGQLVHAGLGAGHHFARGVLFDRFGDDTYAVPSLGGGAGACSGLGMFTDLSGQDSYRAESDLSQGAAASQAGCASDTNLARTVGLMIDGGGEDSYSGGMGYEGGDWGNRVANHASEFAGGLDISLQQGI